MNSRTKGQRIIIPKGLINPNQDAVLEIPKGMEGLEVIVARKVGSSPQATRRAASGGASPWRSSGGQNLGPLLDKVDQQEAFKIQQDLKNLQEARRKLYLDLSKISNTTEEVIQRLQN